MANSEHTLLVVDDEEMNRDVLSRRLQRKGYQVELARNGRQALELVGSGGIDLVLLDVMMPGMDGLEVLRRLRVNHSQSELPVIMATAKGDSEDVVEALELGANDYVVKPLDFPVVLARVQAQLRSKSSGPPAPKSSEPTASEIGPGVVLAGKYRLDSFIGSGTFGSVYRARHLDLDTDFALKVLRTSLASDPDSLARFRREGAAACRLKHPNAVAVHDFEVTEAGVAYLAMELLEGSSLDQELRGSPILPPRRCAEILVPICSALGEAHAAGMVHRDIKPGNVFLHREKGQEVIKVLDFGIARLMGETATSQQLTQDGMLLGTPAYMAPERLENHDYDGRSDVYSLGVMLFQMLTGELPFVAKKGDLMALVVMHVQQPVPSVRRLLDVPRELDALITRSLAKRSAQRPDANTFGAELAEVAGLRRAGGPGAARPGPAVAEPAPPVASQAPPSPVAPGTPPPVSSPPIGAVPPAPGAAPLEPTVAVQLGAAARRPARGLAGWLRRLLPTRSDRAGR